MAIRAIVEGRNIPQERVVDLAVGMTDEYGNTFELIELTTIKPTRKIDGFQDSFIYISGTEKLPTIKYGPRARGNIEFFPNELGIAIGKVARTPENMEMLAATYYDKVWKPLSKTVEKEIKALADKVDEDEYAKERRKNLTLHPGDNKATVDELEKSIASAKKLNEIKKAEAPKEEKRDSQIAQVQRERELNEMNFTKLRKMAESTGFLEPGFTERKDLVGAVLRYEHNKQKGPQEELAVE